LEAPAMDKQFSLRCLDDLDYHLEAPAMDK
jgi:hypothetical protein